MIIVSIRGGGETTIEKIKWWLLIYVACMQIARFAILFSIACWQAFDTCFGVRRVVWNVRNRESRSWECKCWNVWMATKDRIYNAEWVRVQIGRTNMVNDKLHLPDASSALRICIVQLHLEQFRTFSDMCPEMFDNCSRSHERQKTTLECVRGYGKIQIAFESGCKCKCWAV